LGPDEGRLPLNSDGWRHARRILSILDELLKQWPGMMVFKYIQTQRQSGEQVHLPLLQVQSARARGEQELQLPLVGRPEAIPIDALLGPADLVEADDGAVKVIDEDDEDDEGEEDEDVSMISHGTVAGSSRIEQAEFDDYKAIVGLMHRQQQPWVMLSYCWGSRDKITGGPFST